MDGRLDAARDLRLGLIALEQGLVDQDRLVSALGAWARSGRRSLGEILGRRGLVDAPSLVALESLTDRELSARSRQADQPERPEPGPPGDPVPETDATDVPATIAYVPTSRPVADLDPAAAVDMRFRVLRSHAKGGLGEVFLAVDRELNRTVALKQLQANRAHDPASQARFVLEAEITGMLEHPAIVPVYGLGRHPDGRPYYAMRLVEGQTLREAIEQFHRQDARPDRDPCERELAFRRLLRSVVDACNAVAYAHSRGVVHRDLKPENVMLGRFGETFVVDWGVAKPLAGAGGDLAESALLGQLSADAGMTQPGTVVGTPVYMSPEQAAGALDRVGPASDIYGLGAMLYCLLVGRPAFPGGDVKTVLKRVRQGIFPAPRRIRRSIDPALEAICLKAMALEPGDRHGSALELAEALETWLADVRYLDEQEQAVGQMKATLARLSFERAQTCFGRQMHDEGMLWLSRALENAPDDPPDLARVVRTNLSGWHAGEKRLERGLPHHGEVFALALDPGGKQLATGSGDGTARVWDLATGLPLGPRLRHAGPVRAVAFSPDGKRLLTGCDDGSIRRWDLHSGTLAGEPIPAGGPVEMLAASPDGSRLAVAGPIRGPFLWDAATDRPILEADGDVPPIARLAAFQPDGARLAVTGADGVVSIRDAATGRPGGADLAHESAVAALDFHPGGRLLLTGCLDGRVRLWDLEQGQPALTLTLQGEVRRVGFRPDGGAFVTTCVDGAARLWEAESGRPIGEPLAHRAAVDCLGFSPDGTLVATGSRDGTVRLWCAVTGLPIGPELPHGCAVHALAFSRDGRRLATGGSDRVARCWKVPAPMPGDVERISCWVRVATNLEFDAGDAIRRMDTATSWDLRRLLVELGGDPTNR